MAANNVSNHTSTNDLINVESSSASILAIDIGGTNLKILISGQTEPWKTESGKSLTPARMVEVVQELAKDWDYHAVSIGYPGQVGNHGPRSEPQNLGSGWVGFDFAAAFNRPVRIINDAAMQALGSYDGGRMLFLGLGTGLGTAFIAEKVIIPLELGDLPYRGGATIGEVLGRQGYKRLGKRVWRQTLNEVLPILMKAFLVDYIVVGGGQAKKIKKLPHGIRLGHNLTAFRGGFRLWKVNDVQTLSAGDEQHNLKYTPVDWRLI
jgi:polyphosphate glucokinase